MLKCDVVCCSALKCVAVVLQCDAAYCSVLQCVAVCRAALLRLLLVATGIVLQCVALWCNVLQFCCRVLQCDAVSCSVLQCVAQCVAGVLQVCCSNTLQHTATHCNTLQHAATQVLGSTAAGSALESTSLATDITILRPPGVWPWGGGRGIQSASRSTGNAGQILGC